MNPRHFIDTAELSRSPGPALLYFRLDEWTQINAQIGAGDTECVGGRLFFHVSTSVVCYGSSKIMQPADELQTRGYARGSQMVISRAIIV